MSQDVLLTVMNSMSLLDDSVNMDRKRKESYESCDNQNALEILECFENNDLKAQLQDKDNTICKFKDTIKSLREKSKEEHVNYDYCEIETKNVELENNLEPLAPRLLQNREAHLEYLKYTQEQADILRGIVEQVKAEQPLDKELDFACKHAQRIQELLVYVRDTCPNAINLSAKKVAATPKNKVKKVSCAKSAKKYKKENIWRPTGHVFTEVGLKWKLTGRTFTIVGNMCPLTRITSANVVPPKKTTFDLVKTQKPELKVYSRKPKNVKYVVRFENDYIARIIGYGDYQLGNVTISK
ncbi:hypothetical protein Tco_1433197, partial [Tanacetum coccineum]